MADLRQILGMQVTPERAAEHAEAILKWSHGGAVGGALALGGLGALWRSHRALGALIGAVAGVVVGPVVGTTIGVWRAVERNFQRLTQGASR